MNGIRELCAFLGRSRRLVVFTGAGISTQSGIPDYRGPQGIWKRRAPVYFDEFLQSGEARVEYWDYKLEAWPALRDARPNAVHLAAADLYRAGKLLGVITQNIDGLHQMAGIPEEAVIELHGTNCWVECLDCKKRTPPGPHFEEFARTRRPPLCVDCGGFLKPATISFGQNLDPATLAAARNAVRRCDAILALGSTLSVYPAAGLPLEAAARGADYAIINRGATEHDHLPEVKLRCEGDVDDLFPRAVQAVLAEGGAMVQGGMHARPTPKVEIGMRQ